MHPSLEAGLYELKRREDAKSSLASYSNYMLDVVPAFHHTLICEAIDDLLDNDEYNELIILAPPGSAKSTYTSIALPSYFMGRFPKGHILTASYSSELAEKWGRRVRNTVDSPKFNSLFPVTLSKDATAAARWATDQGGEFYGAGVGSGILGFRADLAVIDDPISGFEQAQSMSQLAKVHGWYETDFITRLKPNAKTVLICQRLARNDLAGYMIDRNILNPTRRQRVLKLPMLCTQLPDPLNRQIGDRLWPEWYTPEMVADAQRDDFKWRTLYQQEPPADEGSWVSSEDIQFRPSPAMTPTTPTYGMTDLALSVNTGDYTVHLVVAISPGDEWDIVHAERARVDVNSSASSVVNLTATYHPREWLIDDDNASKVFMPLVATRARELGVAVPWKPMPMRGQDKETRAAPLRGQFKRRKVWMPPDAPWAKWLAAELIMFPNALGQGVDDGVDGLGLLGRRLLAIARPALVVVPKALPTTQQMTLDQLFEDMPAATARRF